MAGDLEAGDRILALDGRYGVVESVVVVASLLGSVVGEVIGAVGRSRFARRLLDALGGGSQSVGRQAGESGVVRTLRPGGDTGGVSLRKRRSWYSDISSNRPDLSKVADRLEKIYKKYPPSSFKCNYCANEALPVIRETGYNAEILGLRDFYEAPNLQIKGPQGNVTIADGTGYHEVIQISTDKGLYYMDSVVYQNYGINPVDWDTYHSLFAYSDKEQYLVRGPRGWTDNTPTNQLTYPPGKP